MKSEINVSVDLNDVAMSLSTDEALFLVREIDTIQADWDFTKDVITMLIQSLIDEGADSSDLKSLKKDIKRLLKWK